MQPPDAFPTPPVLVKPHHVTFSSSSKCSTPDGITLTAPSTQLRLAGVTVWSKSGVSGDAVAFARG